MTEEEKYARKAAMLKRALAAADEMDKADAKKAASAKAKKKADSKEKQEQSDKEAADAAAPQPLN